MSPTQEFCSGACGLAVAGLSHFTIEMYPWLTFVTVLCGAILGLHGVFRMILYYVWKKDSWK